MWFRTGRPNQYDRTQKRNNPRNLIAHVGLECDSVRLPFSEITHLGTMSDNKTAYIYATSHGTEVRLGKYLKPALADSIVREIKAASETTWS